MQVVGKVVGAIREGGHPGQDRRNRDRLGGRGGRLEELRSEGGTRCHHLGRQRRRGVDPPVSPCARRTLVRGRTRVRADQGHRSLGYRQRGGRPAHRRQVRHRLRQQGQGRAEGRRPPLPLGARPTAQTPSFSPSSSRPTWSPASPPASGSSPRRSRRSVPGRGSHPTTRARSSSGRLDHLAGAAASQLVMAGRTTA